jgi:very-short-patch-repair endonuclease
VPTGEGVQKNNTMKYHQIKEITRALRHNATKYEVILWRHLRKKQLNGRKFLRQHAIIYDRTQTEYFFYVPDFYCESEKLAVELDGEIHRFTKKHDAKRDATLNELGIKILRFKNEEVTSDLQTVLQTIKNEFKSVNPSGCRHLP